MTEIVTEASTLPLDEVAPNQSVRASRRERSELRGPDGSCCARMLGPLRWGSPARKE